MADSAPAAAKSKAPKAKKPASKPTHPPTATVINDAIKALKERGGSSLVAIKKYIAANNKVDAEKLAPFIKKYLKDAVVKGDLVQTKGKGASGSFKLSAAASKPKVDRTKESANNNVKANSMKKPAPKEEKENKKSIAKKSNVKGTSKVRSVETKSKSPAKPKSTKQAKTTDKKKPKTTSKKPATAYVWLPKGLKKADMKKLRYVPAKK